MAKDPDFLLELLHQGTSETATVRILQRLCEQRHVRTALRETVKASERFPESFDIRLMKAEMLLVAGFSGLAEKELDALDSPFRRLSRILKLRADILLRQGRHRAAQRFLETYLAIQPEDPDAADLARRTTRLARGEQEDLALSLKALAPCEETGDAESQEAGRAEPLATPTLAEIYCSQGDVEEAIRIYRVIVDRSPDDERSRRRLEALERSRSAGEQGDRPQRELVAILEGWLQKIQEKGDAEPGS